MNIPEDEEISQFNDNYSRECLFHSGSFHLRSSIHESNQRDGDHSNQFRPENLLQIESGMGGVERVHHLVEEISLY